jgi:hypothetical protein
VLCLTAAAVTAGVVHRRVAKFSLFFAFRLRARSAASRRACVGQLVLRPGFLAPPGCHRPLVFSDLK